ncbi:MAG: hypothetical protein ACRDUW_21190, partial [Pseudonocardiaceae bacterium]
THMIDDQAPTIEPDTPTPITDNPPTSTHLQQPSSTGPVNGHLVETMDKDVQTKRHSDGDEGVEEEYDWEEL